MVKTSLIEPPTADQFAIVAAVNDDDCLAHNLARSKLITDDGPEVIYLRGAPSTSIAYNEGLDRTSAEYVIFAHQDVYLPEQFRDRLISAITKVTAEDPNWGVIGVFGVDLKDDHAGAVWSSGLGRAIGAPMNAPCRAQTLDELVLVLRRSAGLRFDEGLPDFHLYGTDIALIAQSRQCGTWIVELPVVHNSKPVRTLGAGFAAAYHYLRGKWRRETPVRTPVLWLTRSGLSLWRTRLRLWRTRAVRTGRAVPQSTDPRKIAHACRYEEVW